MPVDTSVLKHKAPPPVADVNVTPMVDVMLVLLIIFMVITPMLSKGIDVEKYKAKNPVAMQAADKTDAVLISVTRDGKTYLGTTAVPPDQLTPKVKDMLKDRADKTCFLKADIRTKYEVVLEIVQNLQAAGVDSLGLLTEQMQDARRPATPAKSGD
jgi:biopolymer transport protein ExbD